MLHLVVAALLAMSAKYAPRWFLPLYGLMLAAAGLYAVRHDYGLGTSLLMAGATVLALLVFVFREGGEGVHELGPFKVLRWRGREFIMGFNPLGLLILVVPALMLLAR